MCSLQASVIMMVGVCQAPLVKDAWIDGEARKGKAPSDHARHR